MNIQTVSITVDSDEEDRFQEAVEASIGIDLEHNEFRSTKDLTVFTASLDEDELSELQDLISEEFEDIAELNIQ